MVPGNFRLIEQDGYKFPIPLGDSGKVTKIQFWLDNSLDIPGATATDPPVVAAAPQQTLRVAVMDANGHSQKIINPLLVGRGPKDTGTPLVTVAIPTPSSAVAIGISPGDGWTPETISQRIGFVLL